MKLELNLSKKLIVFYLVLAPFIIVGSIYNLIELISGTGTFVSFGAFALFGFILLPVGIYNLVVQNKCVISADKMSVGKNEYAFSAYNFYVVEKTLPFKERPIISLAKKNYYDLVIKEKAKGSVVFQKGLDFSWKNIEKIKVILSQNK